MKHAVSTLALTLLCVLCAFAARADLMVTPKRIVLDSAQSEGVFRLVNVGSEPKSYEVFWRQLRMNDGGALVAVADDAPGSASPLLIVAPTKVTLQPGERQTLRLRPRIPEGLPQGEYMSHLTIRPVGAPVRAADDPGAGVRTNIETRVGFSVPVILRHGNLSAAVGIKPTGIDPAAGTLNIELTRQGDASVYGDVEAYWGKAGGTGTQVALLKGIAVYANISKLAAVVPLAPPDGVAVGPGILQVRYLDPESKNVLAESVVRLD